MLKTTPFHPRTAPLVRAQTWRRWGGYQMASAYDPHPDREYAAVRQAAALFDVSPLHKYLIGGRDAMRLLDRMVTRDVGQVLYTPWCDAAGKVIDDGTVSRLDERVFRLTSAEPNQRWLAMNAVGLDVTIDDVSARTAALALQGPLARTILQQLTSADLGALRYFRLVHTTLRDVPVTVSRTGYSGDLGYEIWVEAPDAVAVWDAVSDAAQGYGMLPYGMGALYMLRIEAGMLLLGADFTSSRFAFNDAHRSTPLELGWGWMFKGMEDDDRPFIGRRALERERAEKTSRWRMVGLVVDWEDYDRVYSSAGLIPPKDHHPVHEDWMVYDADRSRVGYATSIMYSPILQRHIALARVRPDLAKPGTRVFLEFTVDHQYQQVAANAARLPLYNPERKSA